VSSVLGEIDWGDAPAWVAAGIAFLGVVLGALQLKKRASRRPERIRQTQRGGHKSRNYQAGRDLTINGDDAGQHG
jgi:hypothetical protein